MPKQLANGLKILNKQINMSALQISHLTVNYEKTPVLWDVTANIPSGLIGIIGPNGAGKSTLLKAALGLIKPLSGKVTFFGKPLKDVRQKVGYVPQRESVDWDFPINVRNLVLMGRYGHLGLFQRPKKKDIDAAHYYLDQVGMLPFADRQISQLSGGQQQRVFLARALAQEADLYFMDEPFSAIDLATESLMMNILRNLRAEGKTILIVHHDLNTVENYFDYLIILNMRLIASGSVTETFNAQNLMMAYGKSYALFDEALRLAQDKTAGLK